MVEVRIIKVTKIFLKIYTPSLVIALRINKKFNITQISIRSRRLLKLKRVRLEKRKKSADYEKIKIIKCSKKKLALKARKRWWGKS